MSKEKAEKAQDQEPKDPKTGLSVKPEEMGYGDKAKPRVHPHEKARRVMEFKDFRESYDEARKTVDMEKGKRLMGTKEIKAEGAYVRNDSGPYRAYGIEHDKEEADANMKINSRPPAVSTSATKGLAAIAETEGFDLEKFEKTVVDLNEAEKAPARKLSEIAKEIRSDWKKVYFGAVPYLDAMGDIEGDDINGKYYEDSASSVVAYFLSNAGTWKGEVAKRVKKELNDMLKAYYKR